MRIAYLTAGAAGMYCGSCLHDNALAKALIRQGHDALLIPMYTPILTDEENVSSSRLFYGGLNVYLEQAVPLFRWLPNWADQFLSSPRLVGWIASRAMGTSAQDLGPLTVSMLKGSEGRQRKEVRRLGAWLHSQSPDVVVFSNLLIAGGVAALKKQLGCPAVVILQGDDIFYDGLAAPYRQQALTELRKLAEQVDLFVVHSEDYGQRMQQVLGFPSERLAVCPLSIDTSDYVQRPLPPSSTQRPPTIGYLARLAPEKGLHLLVDAFIALQSNPDQATSRLAIAGWLGPQHEAYWRELQEKLDAAGLADRYRYWGSVDRPGKLQFLEEVDVLCVPTVYREPKGLFVLEGLAAGVPYLQPAHGAFPEIHERIGGGHLFDPDPPDELAQRLAEVLSDREALRALGRQGRQAVFDHASTHQQALRFVELLESVRAVHAQRPPKK
ncbi:MAG: glycosyltransferase family 4 protein [Planctomycetales bacterium]|nr:glycosyltransferase family 4 protein [Planctomycetales bacterium]